MMLTTCAPGTGSRGFYLLAVVADGLEGRGEAGDDRIHLLCGLFDWVVHVGDVVLLFG